MVNELTCVWNFLRWPPSRRPFGHPIITWKPPFHETFPHMWVLLSFVDFEIVFEPKKRFLCFRRCDVILFFLQNSFSPVGEFLAGAKWEQMVTGFILYPKGWIRTSLRPRRKIPPRRPSSQPEACAPGLTWRSVTTRRSRWPFPAAPTPAPSRPFRRSVPLPTRPLCTETRSPIFRTPTRGPSASSERRTVNTWRRTAFLTHQEGGRQGTLEPRRAPDRKCLSDKLESLPSLCPANISSSLLLFHEEYSERSLFFGMTAGLLCLWKYFHSKPKNTKRANSKMINNPKQTYFHFYFCNVFISFFLMSRLFVHCFHKCTNLFPLTISKYFKVKLISWLDC